MHYLFAVDFGPPLHEIVEGPSGFWDRGFKVDPHRSRSRGFDFRKWIPPGRETGRAWVFMWRTLALTPLH